ncbi:MAG TPA: 16S rRNA (adenine(1518)-N(6)/adenine(1519)-N(6))-dimethyltransferase RsmA [Stellaceae bacterium]|nr:16S rRNA (adenine(1518)-N(6)/adenine(1519)-N(6))-dimethyltransferase RsmA [Stellaceae bacterium]
MPDAMGSCGAVQRHRKRLGQHFLHDPAVIDRLVREIGPGGEDCFVEIGPGRGALTRRLLSFDLASLDAIEIDRDLAALLRGELAADRRFVLHQGDALDFDLEALASDRGRRLRLVGNLPYNVSTPLLFRFLASRTALLDLHVMLQREVVARIAARPGTADYGRLTVMLAPWVTAERLFDIGPGAFQPPPRVWSSVVRLIVLPEPAFPVGPGFAEVVAAAFTHRRKTLRNALQGLVTASDMESCGVDPSARPETLPPRAFGELAAISALNGRSPPSTEGAPSPSGSVSPSSRNAPPPSARRTMR